VRAVAAEIAARKPSVILYLGVGMVRTMIALASLRLAPIQCASFGHTASTMSRAIDYFILPKDFVASTECFSEKVLALPNEAMPFAPQPAPTFRRQTSDNTIRVAICASTMKLNPVLFEAIARIARGAQAHAEFRFLPIASIGLAYFELSRVVRATIPSATVFPQLPRDRYMERLAQCDFFLCPFPYGNMNGIIDAFQLGLPGVCLDGVEAHAHADAAFFARINLPAELTTQSVDEYVAAAIRLIDDQTWRVYCTEIVRNADLDKAFFRGDAGLFRKAIENLIWPPAR
jgi:predicted O-linked N-acetylglucosamine transferase (SPINDLY family)